MHECSNICIIHLALITPLSSRETLLCCRNPLLPVSVCFIGQTVVPSSQAGFQGPDRLLACLHGAAECERTSLGSRCSWLLQNQEQHGFSTASEQTSCNDERLSLQGLAERCQTWPDCSQVSGFSARYEAMPCECIGVECPRCAGLGVAGVPQVIHPPALWEWVEMVFGGFLLRPWLMLSRRAPPGATERPRGSCRKAASGKAALCKQVEL